MSGPHLRIAVRDVPDAEACMRGINRDTRGLAERYSPMTACHVELAAAAAGFEAHVDLRFPRHQVIVNGVAASPDAAAQEAMRRAAAELARLEVRDPSLLSG